MRRGLILLWLLIPAAAAAYHYGPGQTWLVRDAAAERISRAEAAVQRAEGLLDCSGQDAARGEWRLAVDEYTAAIDALPPEEIAIARRLRLERAKARMHVSELIAAHAELRSLLDEVSADPETDRRLVADTRDALANAQYYMTWLMRLEGLGREKWEPEIEGARQNWRWLAESARDAVDAPALASAERNLESAILLARMDLQELQGLPLPNQ